MNRIAVIPATGCALLLGGALLLQSAVPAQAQSMSGRSRIELRLGAGVRTSSGTSVGAGGVETETEAAGLLGSISYARWRNRDVAFTVSAGVLSVEAKTSVGSGGVETRTALVVPLLAGARFYTPVSDPEAGVRLFGSLEAGPFIGSESATEVGAVVTTDSRTRTAFGARLGAGIDFGLGSRVNLGLHGGYDLVTDFSDPIGGQSNHSGFEFGLAVGLQFGGGAVSVLKPQARRTTARPESRRQAPACRHGWPERSTRPKLNRLHPKTIGTSGHIRRRSPMRTHPIRSVLAFVLLAVSASSAAAQSTELWADMHWRFVGPTRAGRTRALDGVPSRPNVFYIGFDNGGVWRTTDYGSNWEPIFDDQPTGSIGAIAVAPSNPDIIYVGTGAGIIRPDLSTGDGMYKSTDGGETWTHLGLRDSQMIADVIVDPTNPDRLFVAALGHPYGPNEERGIFRSTNGGRTFEKVLYKDEYTSGNDLVFDPADPNTVYAALWQQQEAFRESAAFGGADGGIFKSTDGGTTWTQLTDGLPTVIEANLAVAPADPRLLYAMVAGLPQGGGGRGSTTGTVGLYKSTDAGEHWTAVNVPAGPVGAATPHVDTRPLARIGGGDLPTVTVDPKNENVLYSATVVMWRSEDGGIHWSAVRGAYGGDDYQKIWINPDNPDIILTVSDQGAVISANRGESWSNWYTQPTGAMFHVTADNDFPYRVCAGQQDSGSACVLSRSDDGMITFHDWHPVNIQEYGIAAPDPRDPDMVYGSSRTNVSFYNRRNGQTTDVGPDTGGRGGPFGRNVRTMPILWSPLDPDVLYYTSNVVWKTTDRGRTWTRISPDLARQTWEVPANAGKYASSVTVDAQGAITALSASPLDVGVLWAGTDDGNIQVTMDGGENWTNVTPSEIRPWTRIFNIEAGHFDRNTAYAAANTMRLDDMNPHFWRTHDGGRTWTEIDTGIAPGAVANSIREDPRKPGLLYAATETQVWVSFDDGDHWHSLRMNMPAVSVREIKVKDDTTCWCSDLVAGTHGRGFWILDNVTPLRQIAEAQAASDAYLFEPATALRVRFGMNDPTEWTPELPHGENPLPGGIIDYWLAADASGPVTLDILDTGGTVIRSYSSDDPVLEPDPALDLEGYDRICRQDPSAPNCRVPLYWPAPQMVLSTKRGMHRFSWDLRYEPIGPEPRAGGGATGAVPGRTYPRVNAPWAPPGHYAVRLTVNGRSYTQPLTLRLDPRVETAASHLELVARLSREMWEGATAANAAYEEARAALERLGAGNAELREQLEALAPAARGAGGRGGGFFAAAPSGSPTLNGVSSEMMSAAMAMQEAEVGPTERQVAACAEARAHYQEVMQQWHALQAGLDDFEGVD